MQRGREGRRAMSEADRWRARRLWWVPLILTIAGMAIIGAAGSSSADDPAWTGQYYNNPNLIGSPALTRQDPDINFSWGQESPDPALTPDNFSVRWTRTMTFQAATYRFVTTTDDGVRL